MFEVRFLEDDIVLERSRFVVVERMRGLTGGQHAIMVARPDGTYYQHETPPAAMITWAPEDAHSIPLDALASLHDAVGQKLRLDFPTDRTLRADYLAERTRVDQFINWHLGAT
jgi:hypothetical protein